MRMFVLLFISFIPVPIFIAGFFRRESSVNTSVTA